MTSQVVTNLLLAPKQMMRVKLLKLKRNFCFDVNGRFDNMNGHPVQDDPTGFYTGNWSILHTAGHNPFNFHNTVSKTAYGMLQFPV